MEEQLRRDALEYHRVPTFGKISVTPTKSLVNQRDLALAYSPGVAYRMPGDQIGSERGRDSYLPRKSDRGISNGTAVLGLGDIGALAGKPVMEGKAFLVQKSLPASTCSTSRLRKRIQTSSSRYYATLVSGILMGLTEGMKAQKKRK
jgi:hypothetical protein